MFEEIVFFAVLFSGYQALGDIQWDILDRFLQVVYGIFTKASLS